MWKLLKFLYDHGVGATAQNKYGSTPSSSLRLHGRWRCAGDLARVLERDADLAGAILRYMCGCGSDLRA